MRNIKYLAILSILVFMFQSTFGQEIAITERGDSVVLFANGTWDYYDNYLIDGEAATEIRVNDFSFSKPASSTKKINGSNEAYEVWYNDKTWKRVPVGELNPEADIALQLLDGDAYAMVIYEEIEIPVENLSQIALDNAVDAAPDIRMVDREYREVNGRQLIWMRMDGTTQGIKISYYSYYFSNGKGSIQFHAFTGQGLLEKYKKDIEDLLNGFFVGE